MLTLDTTFLLIGTALLLMLLWQSALVLLRLAPSPLESEFAHFLLRLNLGLLVVPIGVLGILSGVILAAGAPEAHIRFAHAFLTLGLWMSANVMLLALFVSAWRKTPSLVALVGALLSAPLAVYLTPLFRFTSIFSAMSVTLTLLVGVLLVVLCYRVLHQLRTHLSRATIPLEARAGQ